MSCAITVAQRKSFGLRLLMSNPEDCPTCNSNQISMLVSAVASFNEAANIAQRRQMEMEKLCRSALAWEDCITYHQDDLQCMDDMREVLLNAIEKYRERTS